MTSADTLQCTLLWWPSEWFLHVHHCLIEIPRYDSLNIQVLSNVFFLVDCKGANVLIVYEYSDRRKIIIENSLWYIFKMSFYCHKPYNLIYKYMHMVWEKNRLVVNVIKVMGKSNTWLYNFFQSRPNFFFKVDLNVLFRDNTRANWASTCTCREHSYSLYCSYLFCFDS